MKVKGNRRTKYGRIYLISEIFSDHFQVKHPMLCVIIDVLFAIFLVVSLILLAYIGWEIIIKT